MFGNPKLGIGLFLSTVVTFFLIFRQCLLLSTRFFDVFGVRENIEAYGVADKRVASGIGLKQIRNDEQNQKFDENH
jgi:hypothetical protein